ncbi:alpha/beta hydrolase [Schinkia azotoformans]|uniref:Biotin/lipoyl attachment domain-containing protein n=1 Tax=Schinkia azotoformans LMG 9581 TaxID=1131731 RepID=K6CSM2_SCHAZ|nr:alpha/beta hydrolase [Schinkia azotoformans]EKN63242.1 biotin/lipoyl attachment domain-containing protein [Schinkia azotoformans LMG 9581]MEC1637208.1 alpha/beta hydrolase [Schinkia azotoformans]MEC1716951.1 alpha/beta hydrolase [Schinkia azotoformans]MEC1943612.1 alpha/beta hydrolase [Schinkia azotoformans]MED4354921.1 alpha/beta hydrolase [Schinkia azotoformans]
MKERQISFYSEGYKLEGTVYLPDDYVEGEKRPAIIPNSGYNGFNEFYPRLFARNLTEAGFVCLGFDYRGFANSEGENGRVILDEQVEDIMNAITFLQVQPEVDSERIGLIGWGMGGSNVVRVAAKDKRVKAVAALNGFYDGERWLKSIHSYVEWMEIVKTVEQDRITRVTTGKSELADPFIHYPLDPATDDYVQKELAPLSPFGKQTQIQFTDSIMNMNAEKVAKEISPIPLFVGHGKDNLLHPLEESKGLYEAAQEPKQFYLIDGKHNDFMYHEHPVFQSLTSELTLFFNTNLNFLANKVEIA